MSRCCADVHTVMCIEGMGDSSTNIVSLHRLSSSCLHIIDLLVSLYIAIKHSIRQYKLN